MAGPPASPPQEALASPVPGVSSMQACAHTRTHTPACHAQGHPILIQRLGRVDLKALYKVTSEERLKLHHVREYEHLRGAIFPACSRIAGRQVDQLFIIIDLDGISFT